MLPFSYHLTLCLSFGNQPEFALGSQAVIMQLCALPKASMGAWTLQHDPKPRQSAKEGNPLLFFSVSMLNIFPGFLGSVQIFSAFDLGCSWVALAQTQSHCRKRLPSGRPVSQAQPCGSCVHNPEKVQSSGMHCCCQFNHFKNVIYITTIMQRASK